MHMANKNKKRAGHQYFMIDINCSPYAYRNKLKKRAGRSVMKKFKANGQKFTHRPHSSSPAAGYVHANRCSSCMRAPYAYCSQKYARTRIRIYIFKST